MTIPHLFERAECLRASTTADHLATIAEAAIERAGLLIRRNNPRKPWGIEIKLRGSPERAMAFLQRFFGDLPIAGTLANPVMPNIMLIAEAHRLSWHYHDYKRAHLRILHGNVGVSLSPTDEEPAPAVQLPGTYLDIMPGMRHRLMSLSGWAVIAEIAEGAPPGRTDTHRVRDDYGR